MLGFILYVPPSQSFSDEFCQTVGGKRFMRQQRTTTVKQQNIEMEIRSTKKNVPTLHHHRQKEN
jgi:hypothetical protein